MKKILFIALFNSFICVNAQQVSDFKNVIVPKTFKDFEKEDYRMNMRLKVYLQRKNYEAFSENSPTIPTEIQTNPCLASKAEIQNINSSFRNKLKVVFTDCNDNVIGEYEGESRIKDFEKGYQEALEIAVNKIPMQNAKASDQLIIQPKIFKEEELKEIKKEEAKLVIYKANGKNYQINSTKSGSFIMISQENNKVVANFYPSTLQNVYHVEIITENGNYQTIGYIKDNTITIENKTGDNSWSTTTYAK